ncbi:MAG: hypothetical protein EXQ82_04705 [Pseudolabrys sp.]|nr:hypothetical protein [Pseudolabrys sp.]
MIEEFSSGWYLRGDVGIGMSSSYKLGYLPAPANVGNGFVLEHNSRGDQFFIGGGIGMNGTTGCASTLPASTAPSRASTPSAATPAASTLTRET